MKCRYFCRLPLDISPVYLTRGISLNTAAVFVLRLSVFILSAYYTMGSFPTKSKTSADMPKVTDFCPQGSRGCASAHKNRGSPRRGASSEIYLIKCVHACSSVSGSPNFSLPRAILFKRKVMFRASVRMVCFPSSSMSASPFSRPWIEFQY